MTETTHPTLAAALAAFQAEMPKVHKGKTARIPGKNGAPGYSYDYADLADVTAAVMPLLTRHGLSFTCLPTRTEQGGYELVGRLLHASGESVQGALPIAGRQAQEIGSSLTYGRRYLLGCLTGVVTDDDEDGAMASQAPPTQAPRPAPQETPAQAMAQVALNALAGTQVDAMREWWAAEGLGPVHSLNDAQAKAVHDKAAELASVPPA